MASTLPPAYVNNWQPPPPLRLDVAAQLSKEVPYDINFALPIYNDTLTSPRVRLTPFVPSLHAQPFWDAAEPHVEQLFTYYAYVPRSISDLLHQICERFRSNPEWCLFAVIDRTGPKVDSPEAPKRQYEYEGEIREEEGERIAGFMGLMNTSIQNLFTEIGTIVILPSFHRTHVARTAVGLLLRYSLQGPDSVPRGIRFRHVQWIAHVRNLPSIGLAKRMGFKPEGTVRYHIVLPDHELHKREGFEVVRDGKLEPQYARHNAQLSHCWDDWEEGGRELVASIIDAGK